MYVLADCNNFYASCERVFAPQLNGRPVVVLSGNDGCVIARSNEAKALNIPMGVPLFQVRDIIKKHNVHICSTNFVLYGDLSTRIMTILKRFAPSIEVYSIDEAFMDFSGTDMLFDLESYIAEVAKYVHRATGVPVAFGIAPTKTLAKIASRMAKKENEKIYYSLTEKSEIDRVLSQFPVGDVWGIGKKSAQKLNLYGVYNAKNFIDLSSMFIRTKFSITTEKIRNELLGISCFEFENMPSEKESITSSRSFHTAITELNPLKEVLAHFVSNVHSRLVKQSSVCGGVTIYIHTNRFDNETYYFNSQASVFEQHTDSLLELVSVCSKLLENIFVARYAYKKCGVILNDIIPKSGQIVSLFDQEDFERKEKLSKAINSVNSTFGKNTLVSARRGFDSIPVRKDNLSPQYTTDWNDILVVNCKSSK